MTTEQIIRENIPADVDEEMERLFKGALLRHNGLYGPKKYFYPDSFYKSLAPIIPDIELRTDDVWISGFMRCGTHWLGEMTWLLNNNLDFDHARRLHHKLRVKFFEFPLFAENNGIAVQHNLEMYSDIPSQRFFKTHLPLSLLPSKVLDTSKMVYIARDPRDAFLSMYHLLCRWDMAGLKGSMEKTFELFIKNQWMSCPYFDNVLEYWNSREHGNLMFIFYEEMIQDLPAVVRKVAKFFDKTYSESQYEQLCDHLQFDNMKNNEAFKTEKLFQQDMKTISKGKVGSWRKEFTEDMKKEAEKWMWNNLKDTDLPFDIDLQYCKNVHLMSN